MLQLGDFLRLFVWWLPNRKYRPAPIGEQRISDLQHVTLACPLCQSRQDATEKLFERLSNRGNRLQVFFRGYQCDACNTLYNAESCALDEAGVYHVAPWNCPLCQEVNAPESRQCAKCGAGGDDPID